MEKDFSTVELKIEEMEFFLRCLASLKHDYKPKEFNWYFSAFLSSSRTSTLALQQFKNEIPDFSIWYSKWKDKIRKNSLAKLFLDLRNEHVHGKNYPISITRVSGNSKDSSLYFMLKMGYPVPIGAFPEKYTCEYYIDPEYFENVSVPSIDVLSLALEYFLLVLEIIYDIYDKKGVYIDAQQYYTKKNFQSMKKNVINAECEIFDWEMTSLKEEGFSVDDRWEELRGHCDECQINHLFYSYLRRVTPEPYHRPEYFDFHENIPDERGWSHIPAGFSSINEYWNWYKTKYKFKSFNKNRSFAKEFTFRYFSK